MDSETEKTLQMVFLPFPTPGHMIPMVDLAKIFASHGVNCTIITTSAYSRLFEKSMARVSDSDSNSGKPVINTHILDFPAASEVGIEDLGSITPRDRRSKIFPAFYLLQNPIRDFIRKTRPDCIISDMFFPWTSDFAIEIGVPRLVFHTSSLFSMCCEHSVAQHMAHQHAGSDADTVTLHMLPDKIEMRKSQLPEWVRTQTGYTRMNGIIKEAELKSSGIIANAFSELEQAYVDYYSKATGLKIWTVGPVSIHPKINEDLKTARGRTGPIDRATCLEWLDQKKPSSVLYVSFGSLAEFSTDQLREIGAGLEASSCDFLWVVRKSKEGDDWAPEGFKERMRESKKGLIIEDWAPQLLILEHPAIGGMVTHCGWNSILEGVNAGLPLITWPLFAEQFYNERFVVDVLKIGVAVGVTTWCKVEDEQMEIVGREKVEAVVRVLMDGDGEQEGKIRKQAKALSNAAKKAVANGGSSHASLVAFINELKTKKGSDHFSQGLSNN